jgi:hypothetical protein
MDSNTNNYDTTLSTNQNPLIPNFQNINYIQLQNQQDQNYNQTYNPQPQTNQQNILYQNNNQFSQNILQPKSEENIDENYENSQEKKRRHT